MSEFQTWEEFRKELNFTPEEEEEIRVEGEIIKATIKAREKSKMTQTELSKKTGLTQSVISRVEKGVHSPSVSTLVKLLTPLGYTIKVVPISNHKVVSNTNGHKVNNKTEK